MLQCNQAVGAEIMRQELMQSVEAISLLQKHIARQQEFIEILESTGHVKAVEEARALLAAIWASHDFHVVCRDRICATLARLDGAGGCAETGTREMAGG
ncbi:hypothetical protein M2323_003576 [Rhodoblastus acidophilus]|uniref:hypothetical protein n=1 Tax=Rhodoblastus acidophilus TaxID=1074 RepID=UPI0022259222|nr:hypothetical protein [Rhodoblastus acidophilus]MCW2285607.1 hypothetical protein [Rhodoblastus acidophilus]MCW2334635.1 hypothetical protein [Rhodoblastus acidophilus]